MQNSPESTIRSCSKQNLCVISHLQVISLHMFVHVILDSQLVIFNNDPAPIGIASTYIKPLADPGPATLGACPCSRTMAVRGKSIRWCLPEMDRSNSILFRLDSIESLGPPLYKAKHFLKQYVRPMSSLMLLLQGLLF
uniref:Uncharacterized protein n=1 Tax=Arundo donax TaxID=35708 RepID=A0A0A8XY96_ARUDO